MEGQGRNINEYIQNTDKRTEGMSANRIDDRSLEPQVTYKVANEDNKTEKEDESGKEEGGLQRNKNVFTSKVPVVRLQRILFMQEESSAYCDEGKDDEAYGLLNKQYKLGAEVSFMPVLVNFYKILINTERADESPKVVDDLVLLIRDKLKSPPVECQLVGDTFRESKEYLKAMLFYQIAGKIIRFRPTKDKNINIMQSCILGMKLSIMKIVENYPHYKTLISTFYIPFMRTLTQQIHNSSEGNRKGICLIEAACLHHVEICEGLVEDFDASEATLKHSIYLMESTLKGEASNHQLYGAALNNLGATYLRKRQPHEAIECLKKAIDAIMNAQDYSSSEERGSDVERSMSVISQCEDLITAMELN